MLHQVDDAEQMFAAAAEFNPTDCDIAKQLGRSIAICKEGSPKRRNLSSCAGRSTRSAEAHRNRRRYGCSWATTNKDSPSMNGAGN